MPFVFCSLLSHSSEIKFKQLIWILVSKPRCPSKSIYRKAAWGYSHTPKTHRKEADIFNGFIGLLFFPLIMIWPSKQFNFRVTFLPYEDFLIFKCVPVDENSPEELGWRQIRWKISRDDVQTIFSANISNVLNIVLVSGHVYICQDKTPSLTSLWHLIKHVACSNVAIYNYLKSTDG